MQPSLTVENFCFHRWLGRIQIKYQYKISYAARLESSSSSLELIAFEILKSIFNKNSFDLNPSLCVSLAPIAGSNAQK